MPCLNILHSTYYVISHLTLLYHTGLYCSVFCYMNTNTLCCILYSVYRVLYTIYHVLLTISYVFPKSYTASYTASFTIWFTMYYTILSSVLYYIILFCTGLYFIIYYTAILHHIILYTVLYCFHFIFVLCEIVPYCFTSYDSLLHYRLHFIVL